MRHWTAIAALLYAATSAAQPSSYTLSAFVNTDSTYSVRVDMRIAPVPAEPMLYSLLIPASVNTDGLTVTNDARVALLSRGTGYSLFAVLVPQSVSELAISLPGRNSIQRTPTGLGKLEWEFKNKFLSETERRFAEGTAAVPLSAIRLVLPDRYDDRELNASAPGRRLDERMFEIPVSGLGYAWISFPNPGERVSQVAKAMMACLLGLLAVPFQLAPLRKRRLFAFVFILVVALGVLTVAIVYTLRLGVGNLDFLAYSAAAVPSALWSVFAVSYLLVAKVFQGSITGTVTVNNAPAVYIAVKLLDDSKSTVLRERHALNEDGRYEFFVWLWRGGKTVRVVVAYADQSQARGPVTLSKQVRTHELPVVNFTV